MRRLADVVLGLPTAERDRADPIGRRARQGSCPTCGVGLPVRLVRRRGGTPTLARHCERPRELRGAVPPRWRNAYRIGQVEELSAGGFEVPRRRRRGQPGRGRPPDHARVRLGDQHRRGADASPAHRRAELKKRLANRLSDSGAPRRDGGSRGDPQGWTDDEPDGDHDPAMSEGRLTLGDARTLAWREHGPPDGRPLLRFQGMPCPVKWWRFSLRYPRSSRDLSE